MQLHETWIPNSLNRHTMENSHLTLTQYSDVGKDGSAVSKRPDLSVPHEAAKTTHISSPDQPPKQDPDYTHSHQP